MHAIVRGPWLLADDDEAISLVLVIADHALAEAVADHAVADDEHGPTARVASPFGRGVAVLGAEVGEWRFVHHYPGTRAWAVRQGLSRFTRVALAAGPGDYGKSGGQGPHSGLRLIVR